MARWYRSRYGLKRRARLMWIPKTGMIITLIFLLFLLLFSIVERNLKPTIMQIAESRAHLIATETIHNVLYGEVLANINYDELVSVHKDSQQRITMMQANTIKISRIVSQANLAIKESLKNLNDEVIEIPLGQTLGSQLLANYGPKIKVKVVPMGTVNVGFLDEFQQAGINQVRHILYLDIKTTVQIVIPLARQGVTVENQIPIAETVIVGEVPDTFLGINQDGFK